MTPDQQQLRDNLEYIEACLDSLSVSEFMRLYYEEHRYDILKKLLEVQLKEFDRN
jgi:hypothetical protein